MTKEAKEKKLLSLEKMRSLVSGWLHMLDMTLQVELLGSKRPEQNLRLEYGSDNSCYFAEKTGEKVIHLGLSFFKAENKKKLFNDIFYVLGHEMQHFLSTTQRDWVAAQKKCLNMACQKLAKDVLGRPGIRLSKDEDYEKFFRELNAAGVYITLPLLMDTIHSIVNILEDGRIELLREKKHPGFRVYRKLFRSELWIGNDIRKEKNFKPDVKDLDPVERYYIVQGQMYYLATMGWYQKGFLAAYGGTDIHDEVVEIIPNISRAVLSRSCRGCMDEAVAIFEKYLDTIIEICKIPEQAAALMSLLARFLQSVLMGESDNSSYSATTRNEEQGDGMPGESLFGSTVLEIEVDKDTFDKMKEKAEESGDGLSGMSVKVKLKGEDTETGDNGNSGSGAGEGSEEGDNASKKTSSSDEQEDGSESGEGKSSGQDKEKENNKGKDKKEKEENGDPDNQDSGGKSKAQKKKTDSKETNNHSEGAEGSGMSDEDIEAMLKEQMDEAADKPNADFDCAEADAKKDAEFKAAAEKMAPVKPIPIDMKPIEEKYNEKVSFHEMTRAYVPRLRLPFDLEDKGRSLDRKIADIIKSKQIPNRRHLRSGLLDSRKLSALAMGDIDIFKKKGEKVKPEVAAYVLIDNSGSMGNGEGSTRFACCNATAVLEEGFKNHAALKIAAFDSSCSEHVTHEVIKEFDEVVGANLAYNFKHLGRSGCGNKDGYSIRIATQQLLQRQEKNKILIIASDGIPTDYRGGTSAGVADVKAAVQEARSAGIRTIGMYMFHQQGFRDQGLFKEMYAPEIIFASLDDIEIELTNILRQYF